MTDMRIILRELPVPGQSADLGRFILSCRKGANDNLSETQFIQPPEKMLYGFTMYPIASARVEVDFPKGMKSPKSEGLAWLSNCRDLWALRRDWETVLASRGKPRGRQPYYCSGPTGEPVVTAQGTMKYNFSDDNAGEVSGKKFSVTDSECTVPAVRLYGKTTSSKKEIVDVRWETPRVLEIEWDIQERKQYAPLCGWVEIANGHAVKNKPLERENGIIVVGEHHWRETEITAISKRRGIQVALNHPGRK